MDTNDHFTSTRDQFEAENAFLRLKLEMEHNLKEYGNSEVPPEIENIFLRSIYEFEQKYAASEQITVYEKIGKPGFRKYSELHPAELATELQRLYNLMRENQIILDCICEYDDGIIYKFITEELFKHPVDRFLCKEMLIHFTYEEFHLNHDYELRRITEDLVDAILRGGWCEFDAINLYHHINVRGKTHDRLSFGNQVLEFKKLNPQSSLLEFQIDRLTVEEADNRATLEGKISFKTPGIEPEIQTGPAFFQYTFDSQYWEIIGADIHGIL